MLSSLKVLSATLALLLCCLCAKAQELESDSVNVLHGFIVDGDTIYLQQLDAFEINSQAYQMTRREKKRYGRLRKRVLKTYPYAKVTKDLLESYDEELAKLSSKKQKTEYLKLAEDELKAEFEGEIRNMTISEGRILMKLIDRETGDSSYELIKDLKGGFNAFMYQSIARIFGSNLKSKYDAAGDDALIEEIVLQIERGDIYVPPKQAVTAKAQERLDRKARKRQRKLDRLKAKEDAFADLD